MTDSQTNPQTEGSFAELFLQNERAMKEGEVVRGTVLSIDGENVHVDVGFKSEGLIPLWELMDVNARTAFIRISPDPAPSTTCAGLAA